MKLILIAALAKHKVIGKGGKISWHIPDDLKRFKALTTGHTVLMGRKTFESLGKPLPDRRNVVLSSKPIPGIESYQSVGEALRALANEEKVFVIGGGEIYRQFLGLVSIMYLTHIDEAYEGDTFFPDYEHMIGKEFSITEKIDCKGFSFVTYARRETKTSAR